jgi:hypothetical protein
VSNSVVYSQDLIFFATLIIPLMKFRLFYQITPDALSSNFVSDNIMPVVMTPFYSCLTFRLENEIGQSQIPSC